MMTISNNGTKIDRYFWDNQICYSFKQNAIIESLSDSYPFDNILEAGLTDTISGWLVAYGEKVFDENGGSEVAAYFSKYKKDASTMRWNLCLEMRHMHVFATANFSDVVDETIRLALIRAEEPDTPSNRTSLIKAIDQALRTFGKMSKITKANEYKYDKVKSEVNMVDKTGHVVGKQSINMKGQIQIDE